MGRSVVRIIGVVCVFAAIGVVANVLVAWCAAIVHGTSPVPTYAWKDQLRLVEWDKEELVGRSVYHFTAVSAEDTFFSRPPGTVPHWIPSIAELRGYAGVHSAQWAESFSMNLYGLPVPSLFLMEHRYTVPPSAGYTGSVRGYVTVISQHATVLPVHMVPHRFVLSSTVWTSFIASVWFALSVIRRIRRRPGGCPQCNYSLRGLLPTTAVCPECGMPIPVNTSAERSPPRSGDGVEPRVEVAAGDRNPWKGAR